MAYKRFRGFIGGVEEMNKIFTFSNLTVRADSIDGVLEDEYLSKIYIRGTSVTVTRAQGVKVKRYLNSLDKSNIVVR